MIVYCLLLYIVALMCFLKKQHYKVSDKFVCILLIIVSGFRYMVGIDYHNYMNGYNSPDEILYEPIWYIITKALNFLGFSSQSFFLLTSSIIVICTYKAVKKYDRTIVMFALFIFIVTNLYIESMNLIRQYVAMSVAFLAFVYRIERQNVKYLCLMALAFAYHTTALICIPVFEIARYRYKMPTQLILVIISLIVGESISLYFIDFIASHTDSSFIYSSYLSNKSYLVITTGAYKYLLNIFAIYYILRQKSILNNDMYTILNLFVVSVCMYNVFLHFDVGIRLSKYFFYFILLLIPVSLKRCNNVYDYVVIIVLTFGLLLFTLKDVSSPAYTPFQFNFRL